jgi:hypothetical protein
MTASKMILYAIYRLCFLILIKLNFSINIQQIILFFFLRFWLKLIFRFYKICSMIKLIMIWIMLIIIIFIVLVRVLILILIFCIIIMLVIIFVLIILSIRMSNGIWCHIHMILFCPIGFLGGVCKIIIVMEFIFTFFRTLIIVQKLLFLNFYTLK